jgi:hypothetical protein
VKHETSDDNLAPNTQLSMANMQIAINAGLIVTYYSCSADQATTLAQSGEPNNGYRSQHQSA